MIQCVRSLPPLTWYMLTCIVSQHEQVNIHGHTRNFAVQAFEVRNMFVVFSIAVEDPIISMAEQQLMFHVARIHMSESCFGGVTWVQGLASWH